LVFDPNNKEYELGYSFYYNYDYRSGTYVNNGATYNVSKGLMGELIADVGGSVYRGTQGVNTTVTYSKSYVETADRTPNILYREPGDYFSVNLSNHRPETTWVFGRGNTKTGLKTQYYLDNGTLITPSTNLDGHYAFGAFDNSYKEHGYVPGSGSGSYTYWLGHHATSISPIEVPASKDGAAISVALY
jgi:hypothetical protein